MNINECPNCQAEIKAGSQVCPQCGYAFPFATDMLDVGRVLQNRYELVKLIHSGGMGYIYLAQDKRLDRAVVVKQVRQPVKSDAHRKKLEEEALRMAQLSHPAVAMVFNHFVEDDFYFLVEEYIKGQTLSEIFEKSGRKLEESQVINWMVQVCEVIGYLHNKGMVHRDISPDNIMLTDEGHIKLIDFGTLHDLSMIAGKKAGKEGKFGFTPKEQWDGNPVPQSDVFAIGATTYYLLTGFLPVSEECRSGGKPQPSDYSPEFPPIRTKNEQVSLHLQETLRRALQIESSGRYASIGELKLVLAREGQETVALPPPAPGASIVDVPKFKSDRAELTLQKIAVGATSKNWHVTVLLALFFGLFGVDRFYMGQTRWALWKLLTFGGLGLWWLSDLVLWLINRKRFINIQTNFRILNKYSLNIAVLTSCILLIFFAFQFSVKSFEIFNISEKPSLAEGDLIIVNRLSYVFNSPQNSDHIVFYSQGSDHKHTYTFDPFYNQQPSFSIKRIIAIPGDAIEIKNKAVYLNGKLLNEPYINEPPGYFMPERLIPDGQYFVLGDNRNHSSDSHLGWLIPREDIFGKVWFRYWAAEYPDIRFIGIPIALIITVAIIATATLNITKTTNTIRRLPLA
jgi:signal peptidase I